MRYPHLVEPSYHPATVVHPPRSEDSYHRAEREHRLISRYVGWSGLFLAGYFAHAIVRVWL